MLAGALFRDEEVAIEVSIKARQDVTAIPTQVAGNLVRDLTDKVFLFRFGVSSRNVKEQLAPWTIRLAEVLMPLQGAQVLRPQWRSKQDIDCDRNLGFDEPNAAAIEILCNFSQELLRKKIEFGAKAVGLQLPQEALVLLGEVKWQGRKFAGYTFELIDFLRGRAGVELGNLDQGLGYADDEGVGLAFGPAVVIAKNLLEILRPDQVCQGDNDFAILSQDGSRQAQVLALLAKRGTRQRAYGGCGPFVKHIRIGAKRKIRVGILLETRAKVQPVEVPGRRFK
jgi:hypothetical protein